MTPIVRALKQARGPAVERVTCRVWLSLRQTWTGSTIDASWSEFAARHRQQAQVVREKGNGPIFNLTTGGAYRRNLDTQTVTGLVLDADGIGTWDKLQDTMRELGFAMLSHETAGSTLCNKKWRAYLPLAKPIAVRDATERARWVQLFETARSALGVVGGLAVQGFDRAFVRPSQPVFWGTRPSLAAQPRAVVAFDGASFDIVRFFDALPLELRAIEHPVGASALGRGHKIRTSLCVEPAQSTGSLLELAFAEAGLLGPLLGDGMFGVVCPWAGAHTIAGTPSATVIFRGRDGRGVGGFSCLHDHCDGRGTIDVLLALPRDAVLRARHKHMEIMRSVLTTSISMEEEIS